MKENGQGRGRCKISTSEWMPPPAPMPSGYEKITGTSLPHSLRIAEVRYVSVLIGSDLKAPYNMAVNVCILEGGLLFIY